MTTMMMCDGRDADGGGDGACTALVATHCCSRSKRVCFYGFMCVFCRVFILIYPRFLPDPRSRFGERCLLRSSSRLYPFRSTRVL